MIGAAGVFAADVIDRAEVAIDEGAFDAFIGEGGTVNPGVDSVLGEPEAVDAKGLGGSTTVGAGVDWLAKADEGFAPGGRFARVGSAAHPAGGGGGVVMWVGGRGDRTRGRRVVESIGWEGVGERRGRAVGCLNNEGNERVGRSEEHTSELQS